MNDTGVGDGMIRFSCRHPKLIAWVMAVFTVALIVLAALPTVLPKTAAVLNAVAVDTDPENMLPADAPVRVFNDAMKTEFSLYDMVVVGVVDDSDPDGVVQADMLSPSTVDNIEQAGAGAVSFSWLMPEPPTTREAARAIRDSAARLPILDGTLVSEDGKAVALYLPLTSKDLSYRVSKALLAQVADWPDSDQVYITGLAPIRAIRVADKYCKRQPL